MSLPKPSPENPIDAIKHADRRANIPTEELRDFVPDDERNAEAKLYPRDPSLDPQLVWKGKDEQDAEDLAVPVVPIYIQEKIHPQAIIEDFRRSARACAEETPARQFITFLTTSTAWKMTTLSANSISTATTRKANRIGPTAWFWATRSSL